MPWNSKKYARINWKNRPSTATAVGATNLNRMDAFLNEVDNALIEFDAGKLNIATANSMIASLTIDTGTGVVVATQLDGTVYAWDLNLEKIPVSFSLSEDGILTMTTDDGTEWTANISELIKDYVFDDSDTVGFSKEFSNNAYHVTAIVKDGSIEGKHLNPDYRADIQSFKNDAQASASDSEQYSKDSKRWAVGDSAYAGSESDNSKFYSMQSKSYAVGTAGEVREGDAEDNSKYYYEQSKIIFDGLSAGQVTGVKGDKEEKFRKGNVNLTASNIGAIATNGDASLATVTFSQAAALANIQSGDSMATALGKLSKLYAELEGGNMDYWSLLGGKLIQKNSDLDDIKEAGNYYANYTAEISNLINCPVTVDFTMKVFHPSGGPNSNLRAQELISRDGMKFYRLYGGNAWGAWNLLTPKLANNLTTTDEGSALDARVGPVIDGKFDDIQEALTELNGNLQQSTAGRFALPNGLKICWGMATASDGLASITFPITYGASPIIVANMYGMSGNGAIICAMVQASSASGATIHLTYHNGAQIGAATNLVSWVAVGY